MGKSFLMEHSELLYNIENTNKFGKDTVGYLDSSHTLSLYYVIDGHSKHPQSSILVSKFQEYVSSFYNEFKELEPVDSKIVSFLRKIFTDFYLQYQRTLIPGAMSIIIAVFTSGKVITAHLGDCRLGKISGNEISWLTMPHNLAMIYLDKSSDIELQLKTCEYNHIVTRSLNTKTLKEIEFNIFDIESCQYLLVSDGIWKLENENILDLINLREQYFSLTSNIEDDMALIIIDCNTQ